MTREIDYRRLQELVRQGEGQNLEFKRKANFPEKIIREMVAFANAEGGYLLIGVADNGSIHGLKYADEEKYALDKAIVNYIRPKIKFKNFLVPVNGVRSVLVYDISESKKKPHYALSHPKNKWGKAYLRHQDKSVQASREMVEIMRGQRFRNGQKIYYGSNEKILFKYLDDAGKITLSTYCKISGLPRKTASKTLVRLVLSNVLAVVFNDKEDHFKFNTQLPD